MFPPARRRFSRTKPLRMTFPPVEGGGRKSLSVGARSKDTPRTDPSISGEMVPSIVAEDGIALGVYCRLAEGQRHFSTSWQAFVARQQRHPSDGPFHFW